VATTIAASFQGLRTNLEITAPQQITVSGRQQAVRAAVARRLNVLDSFVTGSYKRHTMVAPLNGADIDIFVIMSPEYYSADGYASVLDRVRRVLLETYTSTPRISRNGQAVTITFTDFEVDVVPAFHRQGGGFLIPSTTESRWIPTDPRVHETHISAANSAHSAELVPLIKMIKGWNRAINRAFRSFYLELLVDKSLQNIRISDFASGSRYVFDKGREIVRYVIADPAGFNNSVRGLAGVSNVNDAVSRFQTAYDRARRAEEYERRGDTPNAITEWRKVFGNYFPAYG
jgi:hypothetical protein